MADRETLSKYLRKVTGELRGSQQQVRALEGRGSEPIAIVGMGCHFPGGADGPTKLWDLVIAGREGIGDFPDTRGWDLERLYHPDSDHPGTSYVRRGGFLPGAADFDAEFFDIGPREALAMDPQQRLLLETSWEALEDAGIAPAALRGEPVGVFAGLIHQRYGSGGPPPAEVEGYLGTGTTPSVASGRVAYTLGLEGPAITVDTACSSSLVAMHLACQALRGGECELALAGGATVFATPDLFIEFSRQGGLSPEGRCKSFADGADGVAWAEGVGVLALERLSEARRNGHRVLALIKGSAVNQDGASNGLTAPNGPAQERVIRQALANAGLQPGEVDAVEAHGTGTTLGDPIEAGALLATYGQEREEPLRLGSIKSNIGHAQAAAGVAGVIKIALAMREGVLPKTLHVDRPSSKVDWEAGKVELLSEAVPWEANGHPRRAGVSSFGISGTNAHVILEEPPLAAKGPEAGEASSTGRGAEAGAIRPLPGSRLLVLSARTEPALGEAASRLAARLREDPDLDLTDLSFSLATTRASFAERAVVIAAEREQALQALAAIESGASHPHVARAHARTGKLTYLFTGQGSQRPGMGRELYETQPAYREALDSLCAELDTHLERPLAGILFASPGSPEAALLDDTTYAQPAIFATEVALARLLASQGLRPELLAGHSIGEITAAHIAGVFSLPDACKLVAARGRLMGELPTGGAMVAIEASEAELAEALEGREAELSIAAVNGPASVVASGAREAVEQVAERFSSQGRKTKRLEVSHAFHSPLIEPMLEQFGELAAQLSYAEPRIPIISTLSGSELSPAQAADPAYWVAQARQPVRFAAAVAELAERGASAMVELGPEPVLSAAAAGCLPEQGAPALIGTLREGRPEPMALLGALAGAHCAGAEIDWEAFFAPAAPRRVALPTYPFQRRRYWISSSAPADVGAAGLTDPDHPLLGARIDSPEGTILSGRISLAAHPWLADHAVGATVIFPGTAFLELALHAGALLGAPTVSELTLQAPLVLAEQGAAQIRVFLAEPDEQGARELSIHSRPEPGEEDGDPDWVANAEGLLTAEPPRLAEPLAQWPPPGAEPLAVEGLYERLAAAGFQYGPAFQGLSAAWRDGERICAEVSLAEEQVAEAERFGLHPALSDAALHAIALLGPEPQGPKLPFAWSGVSVCTAGASSLRVVLGGEGESVSLSLYDGDGSGLGAVDSLALRPLDPGRLRQATPAQSAHRLDWVEAELPEPGEQPAAQTELLRVEPDPDPDPAVAARRTAERVLESLQGWLAAEPEGARLALVTEGAVAAREGESPDLAAAGVWGLVRSAQSEHPASFLLIDSDGSAASRAALPAALCGAEPQIALRGGVALAPRVAAAGDSEDSLPVPPAPWRLDSRDRGTLNGLALLAAPDSTAPLGPTGVRIEVRAAGLNFRDVLIALGLYPGEAQIGSEGAGVVAEVGEEVAGLGAGDRVMGLFGDAFAPVAVADAAVLAPIPAGWSFEQAAAIPTVFLTARYALCDLAGLGEGERVLIHAGAGGVGNAAIQLARRLGAEVFATASPEKWEAIEALGVPADHIASSRELEFAERFAAQGIDVVLNSLAGEFIDASLGLLGEGGRFIEMGEGDIRDAGQVAQDRPGVAYRAFDLSEAGTERLGEMLAETLELFGRGSLSHPPLSCWDVRQAPAAFHHLREGRNVGKVVLSLPRGIDPERTVLITGATGALGAAVARRLVAEHGVRHLLLVSRSGAKAPGAKELKAELTELGAQVKLVACDVSDRGQAEALLGKVPKKRPLGAVIHAAGVIEDATLEALGPSGLSSVFAPKAEAAWHLHELTAGLDLCAFVLFSSAAGVLGSPGQGNYAAANAFLDALAQARRAEGRAATSIAWGLWLQQKGMSAGLGEADLARMARAGFGTLTEPEGLALFDAALAAPRPLQLAISLNPAGLAAQAAAGALPPILSGLTRAPARRRAAAAGFSAKLASLSEAELQAHALELVRGEVAAVLGHSAATEIDPGRAFKDLGFDSLAAVELRNRLGAATGLRLAPTVVFDYPNARALAGYLRAEASAGGDSRKVAVHSQASDEPIAIVGMACRYPGGVESPDGLWRLVSAGVDAISGFPTDRGWDLQRLYNPDPDHPGTSYTREGGFLAAAGDFDAEFFGIAPREASESDPQQRLLLEAVWETLEDAGIDPGALRGSQTGVFAGVMYHDYGSTQVGIAPGVSSSLVSGRVAYTLGLEGPAITVDTACSSSLVAMHLAAQALRGGECSLALAGGVTVLASPSVFTEFSRQRGLAPDGRCKSFSDSADGVGWGEGVGVLALERLSDAEANGHPILATIRGSAVNQDGASNGLTAPNGPSQERVIRQALANARLTPQDIDVVEAHGTGTTLGDPIEAGALLATYGQDRDRPLRLGTVKSNIGHTQAAAGVAGVIKTVLAMRESVLPKTLHVDAPSSKVDWEAGEIELLTEAEPWEANGHPRRAGVSSFGVSGTNAHLILEEAPASSLASGDPDPGASSADQVIPGPTPLVLSAKSEPALAAQAERLLAHLKADPNLDPTDVAFSLATGRASFEHRAVAMGEDREQLLGALEAIVAEEEDSGLARGIASAEQKPVFLFAGQGAQHAGMALELLDSSPAFARRIEECGQALAPFVDWSLEEILRDESGAWLDHLDLVQPALFAVMVSLAGLWRDCGVEPAVVVGHSQGEIAAAHVAGALSLQDAARIIALRGAAMAKIAGQGGMLSVSLPAAELSGRLAPFGERLSLAAINGPASLVVSGEPDALAQLRASCEEEDVRTQTIAVDYAAHSAQIEALEEELLEAFAPISPQSGSIPFHSTVSGDLLDTAELGPEYWYRNLRQTVLLEPVLRSLLQGGRRAFVEIGPHPVLGFGLRETIEDVLDGEEGVAVIDSLRREEGGAERFVLSLAQAHSQGVELDWGRFFAGRGAKAVRLPTYPFQRKRYWISASAGPTDAGSLGQGNPEHPLLSAVIEDPQGEGLALTGRLSLATHPWLVDHAVAGTTIFPGTGFVELALRAGEEVGAEDIEELTLQAPLVLAEQGAEQIQVSVGSADDQGNREISIHSRPEAAGEEEEAGEWTCHATGTLASRQADAPAPLGTWPPPGAEPLDVGELYESFADLGLDYGPAFQGVQAAWRDGETIYAEASLDEERSRQAGRFGIHPALLDAALHAGAFALGEGADAPRLPFAWSDVTLYAEGAAELRVAIKPSGEDGISLALHDGSGAPIAAVGSLALRALDPAQLRGNRAKDGLLEVRWSEVSLPEVPAEDASELWRCQPDPDPELDPAAGARALTEQALTALQAHLAAEDSAAVLAILTEGALCAREGESADPVAAAVWGLVRSAQSEHPGRFLLIDSDGTEASLAALPAALALDEEPQIVLREGTALVPRAAPLQGEGDSLLPPAGPWRLDAPTSGTLEGLELIPNSQVLGPLGPTEVRIAMRAAGLNFRDVLVALGFAVPGEGVIGGEGAGVVVDVGEQVSDLAPGDRVMGQMAHAFAPLARSDRDLLAPVPDGWSFEQAAAVPIVFITAYYGLVELARLQPGQKVLIHAGAGGVGMAAIQLAHHRGAEVFATASPSKWDALREAGIAGDHIASSRDLGFKEKFLALTDGEGVDVVLNSLAGEFVDTSLELLPRGGEFLEMGRTDIRDAEQVAAEHPGVSYRAFDIVDMRPARVGEVLSEVTDLFERGALRHSPIADWDVRDAQAAFRHLREGKNVGKVVLTIPRPIDPETTVLLTGATGVLGALIARHLTGEHGARQLLLASRSGEQAEGAPELAEELRELGAEVTIAACDVADRGQLEELLASIPDEHPLGAVIHAAGALDDATIESLGSEQLQRVFAPKVDAAWHLHELTRGADLSAFVLFSSAAATLGGPGQGNYAAANSFLDALAIQRCGEGLPATSIAWGLWEQASAMTAHLEEADLARIRRSGIELLSNERGLELFDQALFAEAPLALAVPLQRAALRAQASAGVLPPIMRGLVRAAARRRASSGSLTTKLAAVPAGEQEAFVLALVRSEVAAVLGHSAATEIDPGRAFKDLGFDSLAAVELRNRLNDTTGLALAPAVVFDYPNSAALAGYLLAQASAGGSEAALESQEHEVRALLASIPLSRLRGTGLLDSLIRLADEGGEGEPEAGGEGESEEIDAMDVEELIRASVDDQNGAGERQVSQREEGSDE